MVRAVALVQIKGGKLKGMGVTAPREIVNKLYDTTAKALNKKRARDAREAGMQPE